MFRIALALAGETQKACRRIRRANSVDASSASSDPPWILPHQPNDSPKGHKTATPDHSGCADDR